MEELTVGDRVTFAVMNFNAADPDNPIPVEICGVIYGIEGDVATIYTEKKFNGADFIVKPLSKLTKK